MPLTLNKRVWVLAERLYIHTHSPAEFTTFLKQFDVDFSGKTYGDFSSIKGQYTFMSQDNYEFAEFMQLVPSYKYLSILTPIVFDSGIQSTQSDNWNYYGEFIKRWYPDLIELINLAGITINRRSEKLLYEEPEHVEEKDDFLSHPFGDPFLDYIRKETNEAYSAGLYLAVMFLSRKILEATTIRLFEVVFPKIVNREYSESNHDLWYDRGRNRYLGFDILIENMKENARTFHEDERLVLESIEHIRPFKNETNLAVHADYKIPDIAYLRSWKIPYVVDLSRRLFKKYCNP